jgi:hypothetical protein
MRKGLLLAAALLLTAAVPSGTFAQGGKFVGDALSQTIVPFQSMTRTMAPAKPAKATRKAKRSKKAKRTRSSKGKKKS